MSFVAIIPEGFSETDSRPLNSLLSPGIEQA